MVPAVAVVPVVEDEVAAAPRPTVAAVVVVAAVRVAATVVAAVRAVVLATAAVVAVRAALPATTEVAVDAAVLPAAAVVAALVVAAVVPATVDAVVVDDRTAPPAAVVAAVLAAVLATAAVVAVRAALPATTEVAVDAAVLPAVAAVVVAAVVAAVVPATVDAVVVEEMAAPPTAAVVAVRAAVSVTAAPPATSGAELSSSSASSAKYGLLAHRFEVDRKELSIEGRQKPIEYPVHPETSLTGTFTNAKSSKKRDGQDISIFVGILIDLIGFEFFSSSVSLSLLSEGYVKEQRTTINALLFQHNADASDMRAKNFVLEIRKMCDIICFIDLQDMYDL